MIRKSNHLASFIILSTLAVLLGFDAIAVADDLGKRATWDVPTAKTVRQNVDHWLSGVALDDTQRFKIQALWPEDNESLAGVTALEQLAVTFAIVHDQAQPIVQLCQSSSIPDEFPEFPMLQDDSTTPFVKNNLKLYLGRWLAQKQLYDEAAGQLNDLTADSVIDPATLLFFQGVVHHRLLQKEKCLPTLKRLLENEEAIPERYAAVASLMKSDIEPLKEDSLDEISRLMADIQRRLKLARAGKRVRNQEDEVIAKLDKLIEELEKKQKEQQQSGSAGGSNNPSKPMEDSQLPAGGGGPGNVDPNRIGNSSGWGNLPPKQREEALQQLSKELPAHYREVIEEYFRKIARESGNR